MADRLIVRDLVVSCRLGVTEAERATPQQVWIDLELAIDARGVAASDDVAHAIDYARLVHRVTERAQAQPTHLLETLAERIAEMVLVEFRTPQVTVRIKKRALPTVDYAAVELTRP